MNDKVNINDCLPVDGGVLVGRVFMPGKTGGPCIVTVIDGEVYDLSRQAATMSTLLERPDAETIARKITGLEWLGSLEAILANTTFSDRNPDKPVLLAPCDLQAVKACGVTFMVSLIERVIEEKAGGDPGKADSLRRLLSDEIGENLHDVVPGSEQALSLKKVLIDKGMWSQYMEVAIGIDAEVFTKCQPLASVGHGDEIGIHPGSEWNNPEPEVVLAVNSHGHIRGATLGNDVNLRDVEGRSALLLGKAKDNNAASAIGPFIRLFDSDFTLDDVRQTVVSLKVSGEDGFVLEGSSNMQSISRDPEELVAQTVNSHHSYPDGFMLYLGTMFAPTQDRDAKNAGFTHKLGDIVEISSPCLGRLINRVNHTDKVGPRDFGVRDLMRSLNSRGLKDLH